MTPRRWLLWCYPHWWRARYGDEFAELLDALPLSPRNVLDTLLGALDARLQRPRATPTPTPAPPPAPVQPVVPPAAPAPVSARRRRGLGPLEHEIGIDRVIREAMERGEFDDLPGAGKPLDLSGYDVANEWRLAYHVLKQAGETLPWIALGTEIDALRQRLREMLEMASPGPPARPRSRQRAAYLDTARRLDGLIASYNNQVPSIRLQQARLPQAAAEAQFDAAWPPG
jgi:hypothetical protein